MVGERVHAYTCVLVGVRVNVCLCASVSVFGYGRVCAYVLYVRDCVCEYEHVYIFCCRATPCRNTDCLAAWSSLTT